jgi:hypothetical protein
MTVEILRSLERNKENINKDKERIKKEYLNYIEIE